MSKYSELQKNFEAEKDYTANLRMRTEQLEASRAELYVALEQAAELAGVHENYTRVGRTDSAFRVRLYIDDLLAEAKQQKESREYYERTERLFPCTCGEKHDGDNVTVDIT